MKAGISNLHIIWNKLFPEKKLRQKDFIIELVRLLAPNNNSTTLDINTHVLYKEQGENKGKKGRCGICSGYGAGYKCWECKNWLHEECYEQHIKENIKI